MANGDCRMTNDDRARGAGRGIWSASVSSDHSPLGGSREFEGRAASGRLGASTVCWASTRWESQASRLRHTRAPFARERECVFRPLAICWVLRVRGPTTRHLGSALWLYLTASSQMAVTASRSKPEEADERVASLKAVVLEWRTSSPSESASHLSPVDWRRT